MNIFSIAGMVVGDDNNKGGSIFATPYRATKNSDTELVIQRAIEGIQRMIKSYASHDDDDKATATKAAIEINPAMKKHWESEIKILREAPRDEKKLREILKVKQKEYDKAKDRENIKRLVPEIEMLEFVLFLVCHRDQE
jgi:hypothetical protein